MTTTWQNTQYPGWYQTHAPYALHAKINDRHYLVHSTHGPNPETIASCDDEQIGIVPGTIFDVWERAEAAMKICEEHARERDGQLEFGANPAVTPEHVTRVVG